MGNNDTSERITLQLLGAFQARRGESVLPNLRQREGERLLAYLALHTKEPVTSKELAQRFWPFEAQMNPGEQGDYPNVRQALRSLRHALGPDAERLTRPYRGGVLLDVSDLSVDVFTFDRLVRDQDPDTWLAAHTEAVALYRGPLLASWNEPWLVNPRKRHQRTYETVLRGLIQHAWQTEQFADVERWTRLLLEYVPDDEDAQRDLLHLLRSRSTSRSPVVRADTTEVTPEAVTPEAVAPEAEALILDAAGGAVPLVSPFYIARDADTHFAGALARRDPIILVKGTRQVGKTSLLARGLDAARQTDARIIVTDFQKINAAEFATPDTLYRTLAASIARQLGISLSFLDGWDEVFGSNLNLEYFLCSHVLPSSEGAVIWVMDEADRLLACPFGSEVFGLFRSWYNERSLNPQSVLSRLTLIIAYATEAHLFITDMNQSPFNVGTRFQLLDFTPDEVGELNRRYHSPLNPGELVSLMEMLGGQPYLTRRAFDQVVSGVPFHKVLSEAGDDEGIFGDHLRRLWLSVSRSPHLLDVLRGVLEGEHRPAPDDFYRLRASGLLAGSGLLQAVFRCRLYETYFARQFGQGG